MKELLCVLHLISNFSHIDFNGDGFISELESPIRCEKVVKKYADGYIMCNWTSWELPGTGSYAVQTKRMKAISLKRLKELEASNCI